MRAQTFKQDAICRQITLFGDFLKYFFIIKLALGVVIKIFVIIANIKNGVSFYPKRLMHLEIKTDAWHIYINGYALAGASER